MLFNNKVQISKADKKLYNKGQEIINSKINSDDHYNSFNEQQTLLRESLNRPVGRASLRRRNNARKFVAKDKMTKKLFMENFFDLYNQCLLLDEDFKDMNELNLYNLCEEVLNNLIKEGYTSWDKIKNESSKFTKELYALCEEKADKNASMNVNADSVKNAKVSDDALINEKDKDEEVDSEDEEEIKEKTKSGKKKVSEVVKDKVVDTIKKEKESAEKEEEDEEEVKEKSKTKKEKEEEETDDTEDDSTTDEEDEDSSDDEKEDDDKDDSSEKDDDKEDEKSDDTEDEKKSESFSFVKRKRFSRPNKMRNNSLFRSIQINVGNKFLNEKRNGVISEDIEMNMDMIFAESLAYYTLLETMNTVGIINLRPSEIKSISKSLILHK